jgi:hypothetical protein
VRLHPDISCINCSDGVRIDHTTPKLSRLVDLPGGAIDPAAVKSKVYDGLRDYTSDVCRDLWRRDEVAAHADAVFDRIEAILDAADPDEPHRWMQEIYDLTLYETVEEPPTRAFLFGTSVLILGGFNWMDGRIADPDDRAAFRKAALAEMKSSYGWMRARYTRLLDDIDGFLDGRRDDLYVTQSNAA